MLNDLFNYFQHDPEQCTPGGEDGNYIMFARATSGDKRNNNKFSPCSLKAIEPVLNAKARSAKGCFTGKLFGSDFPTENSVNFENTFIYYFMV